MDLSTLEAAFIGLISGIAEILPISAEAHNILFLKLFGVPSTPALCNLLIHAAVFVAIYFCSRIQIVKMGRARRLARIPKRRRKRPLDAKSLMDSRYLRTMLIPVVPALLLYGKIHSLGIKLIWLSLLLMINGFVLYIPQFYPGSNKDCRSLTRLEGFLMGLGGSAAVVPGLSGVGTAISVGSICGVDKTYAVNMTLMMEMIIMAGMMAYDVYAIVTSGLGDFSLFILIKYLLSAAAAFLGSFAAIRLMRNLAENSGFSVFSYYCWGIAAFAFILNLMA